MIRLAIRVPRQRAEQALAALLAFAPNGLEEAEPEPGVTEFALYGEQSALPDVEQLAEALGDALLGVDRGVVADDWDVRWREFHKPLRLGSRLGVRPPWEPPLGTELELVIDPGQAFGTGAHATTRLCLELLLEQSPPGAAPAGAAPGPQVVDLGTGSGVLAITAAKLGWAPILALDYDPLAVQAAAINAAVNGVATAIEVAQLDLYLQPVPAAPLVLANLLGPLLLGWCARIGSGASPAPERIIAAGLLVSEADAIRDAFAALGYGELARRSIAEWAGLVLARS